MSCYTCEVCNEMKDGDFEASSETMQHDMVCESCVTEMIECEKCEAVFDEPKYLGSWGDENEPDPTCPKCGAKIDKDSL